MKAKKEFSKVSKGTVSASSLADSLSSAYIKVTNIGKVADVRIDFLGKRLTVGRDIKSYLAGQTTGGAAVDVSLKQGLIQGLQLNVAAGLAGGEAQETENYDTTSLEYYAGKPGELAFKAGAKYNMFLEPLSMNLFVGADAVYSDALLSNGNFAIDAFAAVQRAGIVSFNAGLEGMFLNYKDRDIDNAEYKTAYSFAVNANAVAFGAKLNLNAQYKSANFSHETYNTTEDRFYGYTVDSDFYVANLKDAMIAKASLEFNPKYFISYDIVNINFGGEMFMYDSKIYGLGVDAGLEVGFDDLLGLPVTLFGKGHYYKNSELKKWTDYEGLPEQTFIDFTQIRAGVKFNPVKQLELSCEYVSSPSYLRYNSERVSSFSLNGTIKLD